MYKNTNNKKDERYLSHNLNFFKNQNNWSIKKMSSLFNINYSTLNSFLNNEDCSNPTWGYIDKIASFLNVTTDELMKKDLSKNEPPFLEEVPLLCLNQIKNFHKNDNAENKIESPALIKLENDINIRSGYAIKCNSIIQKNITLPVGSLFIFNTNIENIKENSIIVGYEKNSDEINVYTYKKEMDCMLKSTEYYIKGFNKVKIDNEFKILAQIAYIKLKW